ncbi:unnamed protein product [Ceratitis capitata]|uniref:(Mediterranean fruit fly) hypothetical protein n=1 Tax=Ceratitis capitata TaxID=7213 RepID=A0A811VB90_CERCA|nr:unnamed protein product [Ceratitis capitata]
MFRHKENLLQNCYNGTLTSDNISSDIVDDPGDGLGPLPPKWETAYTERGELYFIDHNTGTSHWLDPRLSKFQKKSLEDCGDDELPYGWEKIEDSLYGTYYIDHVNRRTQYENPVLEAKRRAAEQRQKQQQQPPPPAHPNAAQNMSGAVGDYLQQQLQQLQHHQTLPPPPPPAASTSSNEHQQTQQRPPSTPLTTQLVNGGSIGSGSVGADEGDRVAVSGLGSNNMVDVSQRAMQPPPVNTAPPTAHLPYKFTRNPAEMQGERITASLVKSARGLGITIVGGDDGAEEYLQIKSIVPHGPAWLDGQLQTGDVLVYVNDTCVLGFTHHEMVNIFQSILPGETATLEVCRGYALPFDPNDPNTEVVTTIAVDGVSVAATDKQRRMLLDLHMDGNYNFLDISGGGGGDSASKAHTHNHMRAQQSPATGGLNDGFILMKKPELQVLTFTIVKGAMGFGFTIADSAYGQKVKKILDYNCCTQLQEGDVLLEINGIDVRQQSHLEVVQILKDCSKTEPTHVKIQRGAASTNSASASPSGGIYSSITAPNNPPPVTSNASSSGLGNVAKLRKNFTSALFRKEILPIRPKTPLVDTRRTRAQTPNEELQQHGNNMNAGAGSLTNDEGRLSASKHQLDATAHKSTNSLQEIEALSQEIPYLDPYPKLVTSLSERLAGATLHNDVGGNGGGNAVGMHMATSYHHPVGLSIPSSVVDTMRYDHQEYATAGIRGVGVGGGGGGGAIGNGIYGISPLPNTIGNFYAPQQLPTPPHLSISGASYAPPTTPLSLSTTTAAQHNIMHHHPMQLAPPPHPHPHPHPHVSQYSPASSLHGPTPLQAAHIQNERMQKRVNELLSDRRRVGFTTLDMPPTQKQSSVSYAQQTSSSQQIQHSPAVSSVSQQAPLSWLGAGGYNNTLQSSPGGNLPFVQRNGDLLDELTTEQYELSEVTLERQALGFGFRIVGGTEEGSQVTVGHIVPGGAADNDQRINTGDEILSIDGINVVNSSHHKVVSLMGEAALRGQVTMILRRRLRLAPQQQHQHHRLSLPTTPPPPPAASIINSALRNTYRYPYDVIVSRHESEGFGFVIISSSNQFYGSTIGKLIPGSPADRCGELKVGDRIIAVNRIDIAGMSHGDVVNLIKESGLHVRLTIGCPKDAALTTPPPPSNTALHVNSAQVSPGQLSQSHLIYAPLTTIQQPLQQQQHKAQVSPNLLNSADAGGSYFMEQPRTSVAPTSFVQQQHTQAHLQQQQQQQQYQHEHQQQQQQQQQQLPQQL